MRPLRKGSARSGLRDGLAKLVQHEITKLGLEIGKALHEIATDEPGEAVDNAEASGSNLAENITELQAAIVGGAIKQACEDMAIDEEAFFRYLNENIWRLTRALEASNLLDKVV